MSTPDLQEESAVLTPTERRSRFWSFESWDWWWTAAFAVVALVVCLQIGVAFGTLALVGLVVLWVFSMITMPATKNRFNDRIYMVPFWWIAEWRLISKRGVIWRAGPTKSSNRKSAKKLEEPTDGVALRRKQRATKRQVVRPFPFEAKAYIEAKGSKSIGLIYHQGKQTYSMVFVAPGSSITSRSKRDQYASLKQIAEILRVATLSAGLSGIGIGIGMNSRPQDPWKAPRMMLESCSVRTLAPSALASALPEEEYSSDDKIDVALNKLQAELPYITVQSYKSNMMVVVTMSETNTLRKANSKSDIQQREFKKLPIIRVRDMMLPKLRRIIGEGIEVLDLAGVERYLRMARDAVTLSDYYDEYQERWLDEQVALQTTRQTGEAIHLPAPVYDRYLPTKNITVGKDYANIDGTWFSVLDMTTFPTSHITATEGSTLYDAGTPWMSMAVVGKGVNSNVEYTVSDKAEKSGRDILDFFGYEGGGARSDRKERERYERAAVMDSAGVTMDYVIRFATLAPTRELLDSETEDEITRLSSLGLSPVRVEVRAQQWGKLLTTLTLIDCE